MEKIKYSTLQLEILELNFKTDSYASPETAEALAKQLNVSVKQIRVWYQNRRAKMRREMNKHANLLLTTTNSQRSWWAGSAGGRSPTSSSRSPPTPTISAPGSPASLCDYQPGSVTRTTEPLTNACDAASMTTNYVFPAYDAPSQCSQPSTTTTTYEPSTGSWSACNTLSAHNSLSVQSTATAQNNNGATPNSTMRPAPGPVSPYPNTAFRHEFHSVPTIVVDHAADNDLSVYLGKNARDAADAYPHYGSRDGASRSGSAEPLAAAGRQDGYDEQLRDFGPLGMSHSYVSYCQNIGTYNDQGYGAPSCYNPVWTNPSVPVDHVSHRLQMQETGGQPSGGQMQQVAAAGGDHPQASTSASGNSSSRPAMSGDEAFMKSLAEFLNDN